MNSIINSIFAMESTMPNSIQNSVYNGYLYSAEAMKTKKRADSIGFNPDFVSEAFNKKEDKKGVKWSK